MNIKQVAARAKVSTATISRTINGSQLVNPETAEKVWRAIRELGYYPNTQARSLVSGRSHTFGLIISDIVNPFFPELVKGFEDRAIAGGYEVLLANTGYDSSRMILAVRRMIERQVEGVAIMTSELDRHLVDELARRQLPIVFLDVGKVRDLISNISVDYSGGIRSAMQHLHKLGHRHIGFISGPLRLPSAKIRRDAFLSAARKMRLKIEDRLVVEGNHKMDGGRKAMQSILHAGAPTAVVCSNDLTAMGALQALTEAGFRVPEYVSLVGFDDISLCQYTHPPLTTIRVSRDELGRKAFDALFAMAKHDTGGKTLVLKTELIVRHSTAPPRSLA